MVNRTRTLILATLLHCFTHLYMVALIPLYLSIQADFRLPNIQQATSLVTLQMMAYFLPSVLMGHLADRFSRKTLLGIGLLINAIGFIGLGLSRSYGLAMLSVVVAGIGGSFYHPAAIALLARLYPETTGRALGISGIGASAGFFIGPLYSGWRASLSGSWRTPIIEMGLAGIIVAGIFMMLAEDEPTVGGRISNAELNSFGENGLFGSLKLWVIFLVACLFFSFRDFAGGSMNSLSSLYLQNAHQWTMKQTGLALSMVSLAAGISNPLFGHLSDKGRMRWTIVALVSASLLMMLFPQIDSNWSLVVLLFYGFFFMASYPMIEAALMESVPDKIRGRVCGIFLTICSIVGNMAHWFAGYWVERLGDGARFSSAYKPMYYSLALMVVVSIAGLPLLRVIKEHKTSGNNNVRPEIEGEVAGLWK